MTYMIRVVTAGEQKDTLFGCPILAERFFSECPKGAMMFRNGNFIAYKGDSDAPLRTVVLGTAA